MSWEITDETTDKQRLILIEAAKQVIPEGHYPAEALLAVASHPFDGDPESSTAYTTVVSVMAPHVLRGFIETVHEFLEETYDW